jgi:hypothetical protein
LQGQSQAQPFSSVGVYAGLETAVPGTFIRPSSALKGTAGISHEYHFKSGTKVGANDKLHMIRKITFFSQSWLDSANYLT